MGRVGFAFRADMRNSLETYERLLLTAKGYRNAMLALASATSNFASALETCARQKGAAHPPRPTANSSNSSALLEEEDTRVEEANQGENGNERQHVDSAAGERLMAAAGLHHMMSNQQQLLVCEICLSVF